MIEVLQLAQKSQYAFYLFMRLMAVMSYLHTMVKGKRLHDTHGMHGLRRLLFLENSVNTHQYLAKTIKVFWGSLQSLCMIYLVPPKTGHMTHPPPHPQHKQLSFYILSVLHTKQFAYGDKKLLYVKWKPKALHTGVGRSKMTCGKCFGQYFRRLLRVANSL